MKLQLKKSINIFDVILDNDTYTKSIKLGNEISKSLLQSNNNASYYLFLNSSYLCIDIRNAYSSDRNDEYTQQIKKFIFNKILQVPVYKSSNSHYFDLLEIYNKLDNTNTNTKINIKSLKNIGLYGLCNDLIEVYWSNNLYKKSILNHYIDSSIKFTEQDKLFTKEYVYNQYEYNFNKHEISHQIKHNFIYYNYYPLINKHHLVRLNNLYNIPYLYQGLIICLSNLEINSSAILYIGSVIYKSSADIHIIMSKYFDSAELYQPEIYNNLKRDGVYGIYSGFKGISTIELDNIIKIKKTIEKYYPTGHENFNIHDKSTRQLIGIDKDIKIMPTKYIYGFLDNVKDDIIYNEIKLFNMLKCTKRYIELNNILIISKKKIELDNIILPTKEQIIHAFIYCRKWNIDYFNIFDSKIGNSVYTKSLLNDIYGLHEPLQFNFKTNNKIYFAKKHSLKILSLHKSKNTKNTKNTKKYNKKTNFKIKITDDYFKILEDNTNKFNKIEISYKIDYNGTHKNYKHLLSTLNPINNNIESATKLIDTRRDFTKPYDFQNELWYKVNIMFRYYKHKGNLEREHLDNKVSRILKDYTITQAWLKMYEMIVNCNIIHQSSKDGIFRSFHLCELPGGFISAINNYIYSKTKFKEFKWMAQSLHPGNAQIGDQKGIYERHRDNWSFGADGSGDITKVENIKYYKKYTHNINLITSDCGLDMKTPGLTKVEFSSLVAILYLLPINGNFVYKILTPIEDGFLLNLIYICYLNFKNLILFKPIQNFHSREIYLIGKGYLGTDTILIDKLLNKIDNFDESLDIFNDTYPEEFIHQFMAGYTLLAENCISIYKKHIFYLDNYSELSQEFIDLIEQYYNEKNLDWIHTYNIKPIPDKLKL